MKYRIGFYLMALLLVAGCRNSDNEFPLYLDATQLVEKRTADLLR